jgi:hypothetical protein
MAKKAANKDKGEIVNDFKAEKKAGKKLKEGGIRAWMMFEVLAITEAAAKNSLEQHLEMLCKEKNVTVFRKAFHPVQKVDKPLRDIQTAYSYVAEVELVSETLDRLASIAMNYAPSGLEIISPEKISIDMGEAQGILNSISEMMHRFVAAGAGGVIVKT